ncbi:hypothetical protein Pfo_021413 [Paulownia fortunei]|nr:hypothetical protein Pfo_021413 [Paulownia fortunei]
MVVSAVQTRSSVGTSFKEFAIGIHGGFIKGFLTEFIGILSTSCYGEISLTKDKNEIVFILQKNMCFLLWRRWAYCQLSSVGFSLLNPREICFAYSPLHAFHVLSASLCTVYRSSEAVTIKARK